MTVQNTNDTENFSGNGVATSFPFSIQSQLASDVKATHINTSTVRTTLVKDTDYSVTLNDDGTSTVIFPLGLSAFSTLATGETLEVRRVVDLTQLIKLDNQGPYDPKVVEKGFDKATQMVQQIVPDMPSGADHLIYFDSDGMAQLSLTNTDLQALLSGTITANGEDIIVSVAALKSIVSTTLTDGEFKYLVGYYAAGDTGVVSTYKWISASTGVDDSATILIPDDTPAAGRWLLQNMLNVKQFGVKGDGITDDSALLQTAFNNGVGYMPAGTYVLNSEVSCTNDLELYGEGNKTIINGTVAGFTGSSVISFTGPGITALPALNANVSKGDKSIVFASAPTLVIGDIFLITNPTNGSWSNFRTDYKQGEYCEVDSISGSTVTLKAPLYDSYVAANVNLYKQDSITPNIHNIKIDGNVSGNVVELQYCRGSRITNLYSDHLNNAIISGANCYDTVVSNPNIHNVGDGGDDYGILIFQSQRWVNAGGEVYARRHAVTKGGGVGIPIVVTRDVKTIAMTLKNDWAANVFNADFHGHSEQCQYLDCTIFGGAAWQGKDNGYINCDIYEYGNEFVCIKGAEILGGRHYADNCRLYSFNDPFGGARGVIDIGGNSNAITSNTTEDVTFSLKGTTLKAQSLSASTSIVNIRNRGTAKKINVDIDDLDLQDVNDLGQVLFMDAVSGTEDSDYIIVNNIKSSLTGKKLGNISVNYQAFPMRMQKQSGSETVTTATAEASTSGAAVLYKWVYPKKPHLNLTRNNVGYIGNDIGTAYSRFDTITGFTPFISTGHGANWSSAASVDLNWSAQIDEV